MTGSSFSLGDPAVATGGIKAGATVAGAIFTKSRRFIPHPTSDWGVIYVKFRVELGSDVYAHRPTLFTFRNPDGVGVSSVRSSGGCVEQALVSGSTVRPEQREGLVFVLLEHDDDAKQFPAKWEGYTVEVRVRSEAAERAEREADDAQLAEERAWQAKARC